MSAETPPPPPLPGSTPEPSAAPTPQRPKEIEDFVTESISMLEGLAANNVESARKQAPQPIRRSAGPVPLAWQEATLNVAARCGECGDALPRGRRAAVGIGAPGFLCLPCLRSLEESA